MDRKEAYRRIDAAVYILQTEAGWTDQDVEHALDGLPREEAVEHAERCAKNALGLDDAKAA